MDYSETVRGRFELDKHVDNGSLILEEIREKRELMMDCANKKGYTNDETLKYSQELDDLIYKYQLAINNKSIPNEEVKITFKPMMIWPKALVQL